MLLAEEVAPEIDRLVWSVHSAIWLSHGAELDRVAAEQRLASNDRLLHLGDFLMDGSLTEEITTSRLRYVPRRAGLDRIDELVDSGFVERSGARLRATAALRPVIEALTAARSAVATELWGGHPSAVGTASDLAAKVAESASDDHVVAVAHRELPAPTDDCLRLHHRLVTLRYVRQHDHIAAWAAHDLTAAEMIVVTRLWHGGEVDSDDPNLATLDERGLVTVDPLALTDAGRELRDGIEHETNRRAQQSFGVLDDREADAFSGCLRSLPGTPV